MVNVCVSVTVCVLGGSFLGAISIPRGVIFSSKVGEIVLTAQVCGVKMRPCSVLCILQMTNCAIKNAGNGFDFFLVCRCEISGTKSGSHF